MALEGQGIQDYGFDANPVALQQSVAANLLKQGNDTSPILSPWQGVARLSQALVGSLMARRMLEAQQRAWNQGGNALAQPLALPSFGGVAGTNAPSSDNSGGTDPSEHEKFIRDYAATKGIDPNFAVRVAQSEGLNAWSPKNQNAASSVDKDEQGRPFSFGDFQLNIRDPHAMGSAALAHGIDPRDPMQWKAADAFAIDQMATGGLAPWRGDAAVRGWLASGHGLNAPRIAPSAPGGVASPGAIAANPPLPPPRPTDLDQGAPSPYQVASLAPVAPPSPSPSPTPTPSPQTPLPPAPSPAPTPPPQPTPPPTPALLAQTGNARAGNVPQMVAPSAAGLFTGSNLGPMFHPNVQPLNLSAQGVPAGLPTATGGAPNGMTPQMQQQMSQALAVLSNPYAPPALKQLAMQRYQLLQQYALPNVTFHEQKGTNNELEIDARTGRVLGVIPGGPMRLPANEQLYTAGPNGQAQAVAGVGLQSPTQWEHDKAAAIESGQREAKSQGGNAPATEELEFLDKASGGEAYKEAQTGLSNYNAMAKIIQDNTQGATKAFIDAFGRTINPGASVRQSMYKIILDSQSLPDEIKSEVVSKLDGASELSPNAKAAMLAAAKDKVESYLNTWNAHREAYENVAKSHGYNLQNVIPKLPAMVPMDLGKINSTMTVAPPGVPAGPPPQAGQPSAPGSTSRRPPTPGFVKDGYRFKGGDPARQDNWEKVQ